MAGVVAGVDAGEVAGDVEGDGEDEGDGDGDGVGVGVGVGDCFDVSAGAELAGSIGGSCIAMVEVFAVGVLAAEVDESAVGVVFEVGWVAGVEAVEAVVGEEAGC